SAQRRPRECTRPAGDNSHPPLPVLTPGAPCSCWQPEPAIVPSRRDTSSLAKDRTLGVQKTGQRSAHKEETLWQEFRCSTTTPCPPPYNTWLMPTESGERAGTICG